MFDNPPICDPLELCTSLIREVSGPLHPYLPPVKQHKTKPKNNSSPPPNRMSPGQLEWVLLVCEQAALPPEPHLPIQDYQSSSHIIQYILTIFDTSKFFVSVGLH